MKSKDPQYLEAKRILDDIPFGVTQVFKTTRNGATTGLIANSIDAGLKVMLIADTNIIAKKILISSLNYTNWGLGKVENIPAMKNCLINQNKIKNNPDLNKLPYLPTPNCLKCKHYDKCTITEFSRCGDDWDAVGLTHAKLHVLMNYSNEKSLNGEILQKLLKEVDIIIIDEVDKIPTNLGSSIQVYPYPNLEAFNDLLKGSKYADISTYINIFNNIRHKFDNEIQGLLKYNEEKTLKTYPLLNIDYLLYDKNANMTINDINYRSKVVGSLVGLMMNRDKFNLSVEDIIYSSEINDVLSGNDLKLQYLNTTEKGNIVNLNSNFGIISSFNKFCKLFNNKKIIITTATFGSANYNKIFGNDINKIIMTDVCNTNKIMTYIPDTYNISMLDYWRINDTPAKNYRNRITASIYYYYNRHPDMIFVSMTKQAAHNIEKWMKDDFGIDKIEVDYYGSENMRGVACNNRKMCCIGLPVLPSNTYDIISDSPENSTKMRIGQVHGTYQQATGRVKDPMGKDPSLVYNIGITEYKLYHALINGTERNIELNQPIINASDPNMCLYGNQCINVTINDSLGMPNIIPEDAIKLVKYINKNPDITRQKVLNGRRLKANRLNELLEMDYVKDRVDIIRIGGKTKPTTTYRSKGGL